MKSTSDYDIGLKKLYVTYFSYDMKKIIDELYLIEYQFEILQAKIDICKKKIQLVTDDINELEIRHNIIMETKKYFDHENYKNKVSIRELITYFKNNYNIDGFNLIEWNATLKSLIKEQFELSLIINKNSNEKLIHDSHRNSMIELLGTFERSYSTTIYLFKIKQNELNAKEKERKDIEFKIEKINAQILKHKLKMEQPFIDNFISNLNINK
jgi:hypothetical protein